MLNAFKRTEYVKLRIIITKSWTNMERVSWMTCMPFPHRREFPCTGISLCCDTGDSRLGVLFTNSSKQQTYRAQASIAQLPLTAGI